MAHTPWAVPLPSPSLSERTETAEGQIKRAALGSLMETLKQRVQGGDEIMTRDIRREQARPVFYYKSPLMFNTAFRDLGIDAVYVRLAASQPEEVVRLAREMGMDGFNITSPFKGDILHYLDEVDPDALLIGAVNTVKRKGDRLVGYNTDVAGVLEAVRGSGLDPKGQKAIVLGAGGAGRAACLALVSAGAQVILMNRTLEKARNCGHAPGLQGPAPRSAPQTHSLGHAFSSPPSLPGTVSSSLPPWGAHSWCWMPTTLGLRRSSRMRLGPAAC